MDWTKILGSIFTLIMAYLVISNANQFNTLFSGAGGLLTTETTILQGRNPTNYQQSSLNSQAAYTTPGGGGTAGAAGTILTAVGSLLGGGSRSQVLPYGSSVPIASTFA